MGFSKFDVVTRGSAAGSLIRNLAETAVVGGPAVGEERRNLREFRELAERVTGRKARFSRREGAVQADASVIVTQAFTTLSDYRGAAQTVRTTFEADENLGARNILDTAANVEKLTLVNATKLPDLDDVRVSAGEILQD